jgi:hypothetical protein
MQMSKRIRILASVILFGLGVKEGAEKHAMLACAEWFDIGFGHDHHDQAKRAKQNQKGGGTLIKCLSWFTLG